MRKMILPLVLVASFGASSMALAATSVADGTIKSIDAKTSTFTLQDGKSYKLAPALKVADLKVGEHVKITYDMSGKTMQATKVEMVK